jgi:hypothetical protein
VKTALITIALAIGCVAALANSSATAQTPGSGQVPSSPYVNAPPGAAAPAAPSQPADPNAAYENGLWDSSDWVGEGCSICGGGDCAPPDWYTTQGVRIISRSKARRLPMSFREPDGGLFQAVANGSGGFQVVAPPGSTLPAFEVMSAKSFGLNAAPGYDFTVGHYFMRDKNNNDHFLEFTFWGFNSWSASKIVGGFLLPVYDQTFVYTQAQGNQINAGIPPTATLPGQFGSLRTQFPEPIELPGATADQKTISFAFNNGLEQIGTYKSTMNNIEINGRISPRGEPDQLVLHPDGKWRKECRPGTYMSYLYGIRLMTIDETFNFQSWSEGLDPFTNDGSVRTGHGDYDAVTHNTLLGLQIGADMTFRKCKWTWGVKAKVGPYVNWTTQESNIDAFIDSPQHSALMHLAGSKCEASLIGEVGFEATYKFRPNLVGRAGYDFMWISSVALAPEQLQFVATPVNKINANGSIFAQGVSLGMEWMW